MIPKIIHLCWLSGDPYPAEIQKCLDTWKKYLPDYEVWVWDTKRFDINSIIWTRQAFEAKKYAFAADYIRLYALYNYGGIYLDSDVLVYKSFEPLLNLPYFVGADQIRAFEAAVIGCTPKCKWIKDILDTYKDKTFIKNNGDYDMLTLPCRFHHVLTELGYKFWKISDLSSLKSHNYSIEKKEMFVFDRYFFNSRNAIEVHQTAKSFCAHNYAGSWMKQQQKKTIKNILPKWFVKLVYIVGQKTWKRNKFSWFQIPFEN